MDKNTISLKVSPLSTPSVMTYNILQLLLCFAFVLLFFSPLGSFAFTLIVLCFFTESVSDRQRIICGAFTALSLAITISSRAYGLSLTDDFSSIYYEAYTKICNGDLEAYFLFGKGLEVGLPALFFLISLVSKDLTPNELIFVVSLISISLYIAWLELYGLSNVCNERKGLAVAFSLLMFNLFLSSQITRQFISNLFILYALFSKNKRSVLFYLSLGMLFHLTAIFTYILSLWLLRSNIYRFIFSIIILIASGKLLTILLENSMFGITTLALKGSYWLFNTETSSTDISSLKLILLVDCILLSVIISRKYIISDLNKQYMYLLIGSSVVFIALLSFPMMPIRVTLIINSFLLGWFLSEYLRGLRLFYVKVIFTLLLLFKLRVYITVSPYDDMRLWAQYDWWGLLPGYFLL